MDVLLDSTVSFDETGKLLHNQSRKALYHNCVSLLRLGEALWY